ncbi:MAG: hypothetical protein H6836_10540 [Planctomycetes bacterium]|nr:hypothetical protein [Planctomycetota bacterium]
MTDLSMTQSALDSPISAIRSAFDRFRPLSFLGLSRMVCESGEVFCFLARADGAGSLRLEGHSERYSAMSLIGLARQEALGRDTGFDTGAIADHLASWAPDAYDLGDAGLVLWTQLLRGEARVEQTAAAMLRRRDELAAPGYALASMETGFLLIGLAEALRAGVGGQELRAFADEVAERLSANQDPSTHLFRFARKLRRKNLHRARMDSRLGSFASQVYPTMGFAALARATGDGRARAIATGCAQRLCALQGPQGQWWWVYQQHRAVPAIRYPVYTVHQDAMGPMALLAAALADGYTDRFDPAVLRSFTWFDERPERASDELIAEREGAVWRAVQHDDPQTTGRLGLGAGELRRMGRAAWFNTQDTRGLRPGFVCGECRPYHLGWVLLADAMFEECVAGRAGATSTPLDGS